jgi:E3 ubiquitin-protein ligase TRIP12
MVLSSPIPLVQENLQHTWLQHPFFSAMLLGKLPSDDLDGFDPSYNLLFMLKVLEGLNVVSTVDGY